MENNVQRLSSASELFTVSLLERLNDRWDDPTEITGDLAMEAKWGHRG